ncbi:TolC family protein [Pedobacter sp. UBA4863]|uniref:TolC family protein n=1 Tax=Pedobacter sp. UBA4863 TaxID=1947060 RepID=UPI0025DE1D95|nr:TolC family protein [Pedobacter sp. UBA4863]
MYNIKFILRHFDWSVAKWRNLSSSLSLFKDFSATLEMTHFWASLRVNKIVLLMVATTLFSFKATAQTPVLSLDTILNRIDQNNLQLKSYGLKAESYQYNAKAATAWMAPMVGIGTFMTPYPGQMVMDAKDKGSVMFQVEQDIPNFGKLNAERKFIESKAKAERTTRDVTLNDYKTQAKKLYYTWLVAQQKLAVLEKSSQIMQTMKKVEEIRYPFNQSKLGSVYQTSAKLEETENMKRMQEGEIGRAKAWLNSMMNQQGNTEFKIDSSYIPQFVAATSLDTSSLALSRKDIAKMDYNIQSMQLNIEAMKKQSRPGFKLRFDHMSPLAGGMPKAFSVMGMVSIPIAPWSSKMYKSEVKGMQYEVEAMQMEKAAMLQETQGMLYGMQYQIKTMQQQIAAMEQKIIPTLQKTLDVNVLSYRENKMELPEVIASWEALNMMQNNVLDEKLKLYLMIADYEKELYR